MICIVDSATFTDAVSVAANICLYAYWVLEESPSLCYRGNKISNELLKFHCNMGRITGPFSWTLRRRS